MEIRVAEIMAAAGARELKDGETVLAAIGLPQIACLLAKATHAPELTLLLEIGAANMRPVHTPMALADSRVFHDATCWSGTLDMLGMTLHRGLVDAGFLTALEPDQLGIDARQPKENRKAQHFNGSSDGSDIAALAKRVILMMPHDKRKLPVAAGQMAKPGFPMRPLGAALDFGGAGAHRIVTDKAVIGFDPHTRAAWLLSLHPGIGLNDVLDNTGFDLVRSDSVPETPLPGYEELCLLRDDIDPESIFLGSL
jgi:glutaconate CoA-transferase subunit B